METTNDFGELLNGGLANTLDKAIQRWLNGELTESEVGELDNLLNLLLWAKSRLEQLGN